MLGGIAIAILLVAVIVLLVRSVSATRATRELLASHGIAVGPGSPFSDALTAGRRTGWWVSLVFVLLTVIAYVVAIVATVGTEPEALELFGGAMIALAIPTLLVLGVLAATWVAVSGVRELHRWLQVADLPSTNPDDADPGSEQVRAEGLQLLRRVTWSQAGVTGVGVVAGTLSVLFGAVFVAALFALAASAIACARNPKCI